MKIGNRIAGIIIIILGIFVIFYSGNFIRPQTTSLDASFFPRVIGILLTLTGAILTIKSFASKNEDNKKKLIIHKKELVMVVSFIAYILIVPLIGFLISTPIFIFSLVSYLGSKKMIMNISVGVLVTIGIYYTFTELLRVPLPTGSLF